MPPDVVVYPPDMPPAVLDIVTVPYTPLNHIQARDLIQAVRERYAFTVCCVSVSNRVHNRGFAKGCNLGAANCNAPIIGFLNPDVTIEGPWLETVVSAFEDPDLVIAGNGFNKPANELRYWRVSTFICGAVFFVRRTWFTHVGGFDEGYVWSHEELDLIKRAETTGLGVRELNLPISHASPVSDTDDVSEYKRTNFEAGRQYYRAKWGLPRA